MGAGASTASAKDVRQWSKEEVGESVASIGEAFEPYRDIAIKEGIDGECVLDIDDEELEEYASHVGHLKLPEDKDVADLCHRTLSACEHGCLFDPRGGQRLAGCQTLRGSFSAVWTATIARKDAFFSIFQNLHNYAAESVEFCKPSAFAPIFKKSSNFADFHKIFVDFYSIPPFFGANFTDFFRDFTEC